MIKKHTANTINIQETTCPHLRLEYAPRKHPPGILQHRATNARHHKSTKEWHSSAKNISRHYKEGNSVIRSKWRVKYVNKFKYRNKTRCAGISINIAVSSCSHEEFTNTKPSYAMKSQSRSGTKITVHLVQSVAMTCRYQMIKKRTSVIDRLSHTRLDEGNMTHQSCLPVICIPASKSLMHVAQRKVKSLKRMLYLAYIVFNG